MDWLRRFIGFHDRSQQDANPLRNPTWEEIRRSEGTPPSAGPFVGGDDDFTPFKDFESSYSSLFNEMDNMLRQFNMMMEDFQRHPGQVITKLPAIDEDPSDHKSPRDFLLKEPDSEPSEDSNNPPDGHTPHHPYSPYFGPTHPYSGPADDDDDGENDGYHDEFHRFGGGFGIQVFDPHRMIDDFFKDFGGWNFGEMQPFGENPDSHALPGPGTDSGGHSRDSLIKKEDTDLDDRITGGLSQLLKEEKGPSYSYDAPPTSPDSSVPNVIQPETDRSQPGIRGSYRSTSIVRIRRSDGTIEETKRYTDSSGREEVIVTHSQPDNGSGSGPLQQPGELEGANSHDGYWPFIFSKIFTR
ncbi:uncharacterized protein LOC121858358 [Homarus americanus]|uniref:HCLS1-associated protein X-1-like n=1 Tax=Homarus americanus TaxID=6706 RepID=A0A8J5TMP4_HOMAM|nr:uncharacterized protein LOC121858358 [Homarus americanus]KAG7175428.1 HCLS1-associated protein X-1-like [Homarus americanus]